MDGLNGWMDGLVDEWKGWIVGFWMDLWSSYMEFNGWIISMDA